jgi:hypothetical protein
MTNLARGTFDVNTTTILVADGKHSYEFAYTLPGETRT